MHLPGSQMCCFNAGPDQQADTEMRHLRLGEVEKTAFGFSSMAGNKC